jgi:endonuclease/exonuclease/phosphatase family metal-dependent hydrolase
MRVRIGTFNLNNLFSRFNFQGSVDATPPADAGGLTLTFDGDQFKVRTFVGRLVRAKDADDTIEVARRIKEVMDADVLAVQEVEHINILKQFNRDHLDNLYPHIALVEGNDQRLIDVGVMSKLPLGPIVSHQTAVHPDEPGKRVFSRDLIQVEIVKDNGDKLLTIYNTHLKSHFVPFNQDPVAGAEAADERRQRQAETISRIISRMERPNSKFVLTGDMNDPPDSAFLKPMLTVDGQQLVNALASATETRPAKNETAGQGPGPQSGVPWTHRFNPPGPEFPRYELLDQIWLSPALADKFEGATIDRRTKHGGDGSDHDPAWIDLEI